jgi:GNAT superfamily N-acetyltransferase
MSMEIQIRAANELSEAEHQQIQDLDRQAFSLPDPHGYTEWSVNHWHVLVKLDGRYVSHIGIVERTGTVNGQPVKLGGIGAVGTLPEWRRRGLAQRAMERAAQFLRDELAVEFGLLICDQHMLPYYRKLGWQVVEGPLTFDQPQGKVTFADVTMILPCTKEDWPPGVIDLCGLPW